MKVERPASRPPIPPEAKCVFRGVIFDIYQWEQKMFDGTTAIFEKARRPDTAEVIPVTADGRIIVVEEEQPGRPPFFAFPGGRVDPGEDPGVAAKRELLEETGYASDQDMRLWYALQPHNKMDWAVFVFIAQNCRKVQEADPGRGEKISVSLLDFEDLVSAVTEHDFHDEEAVLRFLRARHDPAKMLEIKKTFGIA